MEIIFVRHTTVKNVGNFCYGQSNVDLEDSFEAEAAEAKLKLERFSPDLVITSTLDRAIRLSEYLYPGQYTTDARINEIDMGSWEMKKWEEIDQSILNDWMEHYVDAKPHGGESYQDLYNRGVLFLESLVARPLERVVIVGHAGMIRSMIAYVLGLPLKHAFRIKIKFAGTSKVSVESGNWSLHHLNG